MVGGHGDDYCQDQHFVQRHGRVLHCSRRPQLALQVLPEHLLWPFGEATTRGWVLGPFRSPTVLLKMLPTLLLQEQVPGGEQTARGRARTVMEMVWALASAWVGMGVEHGGKPAEGGGMAAVRLAPGITQEL